MHEFKPYKFFEIKENKNNFNFNKSLENTTLQELLILENFYDNKKLDKIANYIYYNKLLNHKLFII